MTIIQTRYRDIPWEEAMKCDPRATDQNRAVWESVRGTPVLIETPHATQLVNYPWACGGPFYAIAGDPYHAVCPHLAEIGD